jgi:hypothetical protein
MPISELTQLVEPPSLRKELLDLFKDQEELIVRADSILRELTHNSVEDDYNSDCTTDGGSEASSGFEFKIILRKLNSNISCLMALLPSMEHTLNSQEAGRPPNLLEDFHVSDAARSYVYNVRDKFSEAETRLVSRLGEANFQRHVAIRRRVLCEQGESPLEDADEFGLGGPKSTFVPTTTFHDSGLETQSAVSVASHSSFKTDNSEFRGSSRVPDLPDGAYDGPFPCSICGHVLKNIKTRYHWK